MKFSSFVSKNTQEVSGHEELRSAVSECWLNILSVSPSSVQYTHLVTGSKKKIFLLLTEIFLYLQSFCLLMSLAKEEHLKEKRKEKTNLLTWKFVF